MKIRYPEYYKKFACLAGECPDTCCIGWEIKVDKKSEKRYCRAAKNGGAFGKKLRQHIRHGKIAGDGQHCPFLDESGLCEMYRELGKDALCRACIRYPRHMEDYGELHEVLLLLSCPEVCRLVLEENSGGYYLKRKPERHGNMEGIDTELLSVLLKVRDAAWKLGAEEELSWDNRMLMVLALGHDVQRRIASGRPAEAEPILHRYEAEGAPQRFMQKLSGSPGKALASAAGSNVPGERRAPERFLFMSDFMEILAELTPVGDVWPEMLERSRAALYHSTDSRGRYQSDRETFFLENPGICRQWERIFGYFTYSFVLSSLYDRDVYSKIKMAVFCTLAVGELDMAAWREKKAGLTGLPEAAGTLSSCSITVEDQVRICHVFARQIENSDENRMHLEQVLKKNGFGIRQCKKALVVKSTHRQAE